MPSIRGKVATVLDEDQIAINVGSNDGVQEGAKVVILREVNIPDPSIEGGSLGTAFVRKASLKVEIVEPRFSVARVSKVNRSQSLFMTNMEPEFVFVDDPAREGKGRLFVQANDPIEVSVSGN
ncbi:FlgT C-terminal domain-containing protein [Pseudarthrobacter sp. BIM B-2242]|uniref:FlgT C-terminal domain-containing protein n=1 Tax=Pseudarthrobacter sp. BIM B-2242 TaxID=2772401 RepID=UPI00168ACE91|nr:FlgT C-terminal domain-containing protein [Pseudarthrobacter sp. BIM B-2242]QOD04383.1 hypothetical protein IDT60_04795 [Pseudarthrobacter sp. BIM B-2242]